MRNENLLFAFGGVMVGFGLGFLARHFFGKKKEKSRKRELVDEMVNEVLEETGLSRKEDEETELPDKEDDGEPTNFEKRREEIRTKLKRRWEGDIDYSTMYVKKGTLQSGDGVPTIRLTEEELAGLLAESEKKETEEEELEENEEEAEDSLDWEAINFHEKNKGKKPKIISHEDWLEAPGFLTKEDLFYYVYSHDLVDDTGNALNAKEEEVLIGDALTKYDFVESEEETVIYVLSYETDTIYRIEKVFEEFVEFE